MSSKCCLLTLASLLALLALLGRPALAQPEPPPGVDPLAPDAGPATPTAPTEPVAPPSTVSTAPETAPAADAHDATAEARPVGLTLGIGLGYALPTNLNTPNLTSVRIRLASGLTIEPRVELSLTKQSMDAGGPSTDNSLKAFSLGANLRLPMASRRRIDLDLVGGAALDTAVTDPDGASNNTTTTSMVFAWGVGLDVWLRQTATISLTATNPLVSYTRQTQEVAGGPDMKSSTTAIGAVFDPVVDLMVHLYF